MIVSTPYTEVYVKKSFLTDSPCFGNDDTIFGVLFGIRFVRGRAPLFVVYLPEIGALYDKVDQCAIFKHQNVPEENIEMHDVGWWDSISENWQLTQISGLKGWDVEGYMRTGRKTFGTYLWTCDPLQPLGNDYGQSEVWHEHKTKTFFFDNKTGVLVCVPNNKMRLYDSSLTPEALSSPHWLKVYKDSYSPSRTSHEQEGYFGDSDNFDYSKNKDDE